MTSILLTLPDEILLEICKYLLGGHVLYSFYGLNTRLNVCITGYCRYVSLTEMTFEQCEYLCSSILPRIGCDIRSIMISNAWSVLQGKLFAQYFAHRMSSSFVYLEKLSLICFTGDQLEMFIDTLHGLEHLIELEIRDLLTDQPNLFQHIVNANHQRFISLHFKTNYFLLPILPCPQIIDLTLSLQTIDKLPSLLSLIPNIRRLYVTIDERSLLNISFVELNPLIYLINFTLRCYNYCWIFSELTSLLEKLPIVEYLSLQLSSQDSRLINNKQLFNILPKPIRQFNWVLRYFFDSIDEININDLLTSSYPMNCLINENEQWAIVHTIPYRFPLLNVASSMVKQMVDKNNYTNVKNFYDYNGLTLSEALPILARCYRVRQVDIRLYDEDAPPSSVSQQQQPSLILPKLFHLKCLWLLHSSRDYQSLKLLLQFAPNLSELFIAFDNLLSFFDDNETCQLLENHINYLLIIKPAPTAPTHFTEQYASRLATIFTRLRHLQIDVTDGAPIESIVLAILTAFKDRSQLISLVVEGQSTCVELKTNTRQWLIENTHLHAHIKFDAEFKEQTNRFLLWM